MENTYSWVFQKYIFIRFLGVALEVNSRTLRGCVDLNIRLLGVALAANNIDTFRYLLYLLMSKLYLLFHIAIIYYRIYYQ